MSDKVVYFGEDAKRLSEDSVKAFAKKTDTKYFIKTAQVGPEAGHFLNPWSMWTTDAYYKSYSRERGKPAYIYKEVNEQVFQYYLRFLETRNTTHYRYAERG